jgi:sugar phosphate isomerase/epimerase
MTSQISLPSSRKIPLAYASCSIGCHSSDTLPRKLEAIADAGFTAIELSFPDLQAYASDILSRRVADDNYKDLGIAAREVRHQCNAVNLEIMMLQPFAHFEGWPRESVERAQAFSRARGWIEIMQACETDLLQASSRLMSRVFSHV